MNEFKDKAAIFNMVEEYVVHYQGKVKLAEQQEATRSAGLARPQSWCTVQGRAQRP
jgi:hypothetical protein